MKIYFIMLSLLMVSCVTTAPTEYQLWSSRPTPTIWTKNSIWGVVILDSNGSIIRNLTVRFTEDAADSCTSGDYKKVKIISEYPERSEKFIGAPAYEIKGSALIIDLSANLCDSGYELRGKISEIGIEGHHQQVTMLGGKTAGRFYGLPLGD